MQDVELLVIGGGAAGQSAAIAAANAGVQTMLVDEGPVPTEWMSRQVPRWYGERLPAPGDHAVVTRRYRESRPELDEATRIGVDVRTGCTCWALFDDRVAGLYDGSSVWFVRAERIILATGSYEHPLAFPGRSLPGVLGGLGALDLVETRGKVGGNRAVVLGAGDFGLEVARRLQVAGHTVVALVEIDQQPGGDDELLAQIEQGGTEIITGYTVVYATGTDEVEQVMLAGVDENGQRIAGESFPIPADTLCVAVGRAPSIDLAYLAGCSFRFDWRLGGYVPVVNEDMETTVSGVYAVGDAAGSPDSTFRTTDTARAQAVIAANSAAIALGKQPAASHSSGQAALSATGHELTNPWQQAALEIASDDVVVCRCEGIARRALEREFEVVGTRIPDELKRVSRAGMGVCQGRGCRLPIATLLAARAGLSVNEIPIASYRPPVRPVPLGALASVDPPAEPLLPVFAELQTQLESEAGNGLLDADRLDAARYKIREENHFAQGLPEDEVERRATQLGVTIRTVWVH